MNSNNGQSIPANTAQAAESQETQRTHSFAQDNYDAYHEGQHQEEEQTPWGSGAIKASAVSCQYLGTNENLEFWDEEDYVGDWTIKSIRCEEVAEFQDSVSQEESKADEEDIFNRELYSLIALR